MSGISSAGLKPGHKRCGSVCELELFTGSFTFVAALCSFAFCTLKNSFYIPLSGLMTSLCFGIVFANVFLLYLKALEYGPLSITALMINFSLIFPLGYSFIILNEPIKTTQIFGLLLLMICLFLFIKPNKGEVNEGKEKKQPSFKWFVYALSAMVSNGAISIIMKVYAQKTGNVYFAPFLGYSYLFAAITSVFVFLYLKSRCKWKIGKKFFSRITLISALLVGLSNFGMNLVVVLLATGMSASVVYPAIQGGGPVVTALISRLLFREKLDKTKTASIALGCVSIILLSI